METTPVHSLSFSGVVSESKRIVRANYSHFVALSLFFLPLAFSIVISPTLRLSGQFFTADHLHNFPPNLHKPLISHLLCILILYILAFCAIGTITYSTYHVFQGKPIKFFTSLKSLIISFFPLVSTSIVIHLLLFCISLSFLIFVGSIVMLAQNLGFVIDHNSIHFMWFSAVVGAILLAILIYFQVNWSLAFVIAVTESKWGFDPLMRSSYLTKGMRSVSLSLLLYYGVFCALMVLVYTNSALFYLRSWPTVFLTTLCSYFLMMYMLMSTASNTVLYMYCKALHGELAIEIAEQFAYINLPSDDEKVPLIVTVAAA
ncbi:hypothetical protein L6452_13129 [Arctium lappa]|uniref:Uncharacterized protein n=1 Tax=Arctium lappa TaxID=4217 RepID=A0ACB9CHB0_ARCLA|nr:hypothetical protein L6452_13129 [Arctium lappa]